MRVVVVVLLGVLGSTAGAEDNEEEDEERQDTPPLSGGYLEPIATVGAMLGAPETVATILGLGLRGGMWFGEIGGELAVDYAKLGSPDPEGFDTLSWDNTSIRRTRAMAGARFPRARTGSRRSWVRVAFGAERVSIETDLSSWDSGPTHESGVGYGYSVEVAYGAVYGEGFPRGGFELAANLSGHNGAPVAYYALDYSGLAFEARFVIAFDP